MLRILGKRYPLSKVMLLPVRVQGVEAPPEIVGAIRYVNRWKLADVIITGRGGSSIEDLWAFNDERVARAIYASEIPVISAVGHEPDVTISDLVADLRAATPSNAAELAAPDQMELKTALWNAQTRMNAAMDRKVKLARRQLDSLKNARVLQSPTAYTQDRRMRLDALQQRLLRLSQGILSAKRQQFTRLAAGLDAMSPLKVLSRGYSMAFSADGSIIKSAAQVHPGDPIRIQTGDGAFNTRVTDPNEQDKTR